MTQSYAQVYRWVDKDGQVHFTDNPSQIPADRLNRSQEWPPAASQGKFSHSETTAPPASATSKASPTGASADRLALQQQETAIKARIAAAQKERQHYLEQIDAMRPAQMNPAIGGQKRRYVVEWGRSLAEVERQLDASREELQQVQSKLQALEQTPPPGAAAASQAQDVLFDKQGHTRAYWQRRSAPLHNRIQRARAQRQGILAQLSADSQTAVGRGRGTEVLQLTHELQQVNQELDSATTTLQNLEQEAARAGAPAAWLQRKAS